MNDAMTSQDQVIETLAAEVRVAGSKDAGECAETMAVLRDAREAKTGLTFDAALARFVQHAQDVINAHMAAHFPRLEVPVLVAQVGPRYVRIANTEGGRATCVHCFVDRRTGDVLKSAGWSRPAKHARGNIFHADGGKGAVTAYGAKYL